MEETNRKEDKVGRKCGRKALTPEARENQLISYAMDEAELRIKEHTASSQLICHFLELGTEKSQLTKEKLRHETELLKAKKESLETMKETEALCNQALTAMQSYKGESDG